MPQKKDFIMFVGSYSEATETGVHVFSLDADTGALNEIGDAQGFRNMCFLDVDHVNRRVYAVAETEAGEDQRALAVAFSFDPASGQLSPLNSQESVGQATCHIHVNPVDRYVLASSYSGGMIGMLPVDEDGKLAPRSDMHAHLGAGEHPTRQDRSHVHSAYVDESRRFIYVADLGIDRIKVYTADTENWKLVPVGEAVAHPGSGPRHMAFHPTKPYVYVINELNATLTAYLKDEESGMLCEIHTISTLPEDISAEVREGNSCAEIQISPDGRFVYGSNRGHDSIAVYAVNEASGRLTLVEIAQSLGQRPRSFAISPDGRFLIAAHQDTANVVVFRIDADTGRLQDTGHRAEVEKGVCVRFWNS
ncbi:lactonase family protein [Paenibacillus cremeus]|uniref:Lactonase family protein n=1 Tax=Paenibacillus cremeus TaxID=2163881 RepID=A0A559KEI3_9BACL|nr:lactonase family protein [Paenibacillus cremeus]TVY10535.1 lactonase family protein [Paenibacillus cremeus]